MKSIKNDRYTISLLILDFATFLYIAMAHIIYVKFDIGLMVMIIAGIILPLIFRFIALYFFHYYFSVKNHERIFTIISNFKRGKFLIQNGDVKRNDPDSIVLKELVQVGKYLDNIVTSQRDEIDTFHEFYNNIVFSLSSFFIVLDDSENVVYANDDFCKKFNFDMDNISGKSIENVFYFVNARLKGGISQARSQGKTVVLEKTHLLSVNKVSIIADIKISNIKVKGKNQIILIFDDVTNKLRKDYQISLMSQISESLQKDDKIEHVLYTILTGITSGSGLGFNRAMLFLVENKVLAGKMAVGPDSMEEAIEIWSSVTTAGGAGSDNYQPELNEKELMKKVLSASFSLSDDNIFVTSLKNRETSHVYDSWHDDRVGDDIRELMEVKEFVIVPIIAVNTPIGIVIVDNKFNQVPIGSDSIELLTIFASQAGLSIESHNNLVVVKKEMEKIENRQDAIVESEKMAAVGRIAAHIAHEIRNPLVTMGGYARRIMQKTKDNPKIAGSVAKSAEIILKESERLEKILSNVMDFTRPSKFIKEFNNVNDVIDDTVNLLKNVFLERQIRVTVDLDKEIPLVKSDFNQMKQVMLNLLQNSIEVIPAGGEVEILSEYNDEMVIIKVKDTGSGIDEEDPNIVFEPFFTTKVTGVGLGLANVKKIIKDHGGKIEVRNRSEAGVEFTISLPVPA